MTTTSDYRTTHEEGGAAPGTAERGGAVPPCPVDTYSVSVIIAAYDERRWQDILDAHRSAEEQTCPPLETIIVVDHNPALLARLHRALPHRLVVPNEGPRGASAARNTGARRAKGSWLAFMDDDAVATPDWLAQLTAHCDTQAVLGVGGGISPLWQTPRPRWFPDEFAWVVGASYRGLPETTAAVRNVWAGNMLVSRAVFESVGGFRTGFGKDGARPAPEDTDFCLRAARAVPGSSWIYEPEALNGHKVPAHRASRRFFLRRCFAEGRGKVELMRMLSRSESTAAELAHAGRLPGAVLREVRAWVRGDAGAAERATAIVLGLVMVAAGMTAGLMTPHAETRHDSGSEKGA